MARSRPRDAELFRADGEGDNPSDAVHLAALGSEADDLGLSVAEDGTAIFASDRRGAPASATSL